jgi:hypothetical protein
MKRIVKMSMLLVVLLGLLANVGLAAEMKTVVIENFPPDPHKTMWAEQYVKNLENAGFIEGQNLVVHILQDQNLNAEIAYIRQLQPDLIIDMSIDNRLVPIFRGATIPLLIETRVAEFVDPQGVPRENITGTYSTLKDMVYNSYKFLQLVAPLKSGQQVVLLDNSHFILVPKEEVMEALQRKLWRRCNGCRFR